jgi:hypothetical protein
MMAGCENVKMGKAWLPPRLSYTQMAIAFSPEHCSIDGEISFGGRFGVVLGSV